MMQPIDRPLDAIDLDRLWDDVRVDPTQALQSPEGYRFRRITDEQAVTWFGADVATAENLADLNTEARREE